MERGVRRASAAAPRRLKRAVSSASSGGRESVRGSEFGAFLSDSSSDEDEEDEAARALARMQLQADDLEYAPDGLEFSLASPGVVAEEREEDAQEQPRDSDDSQQLRRSSEDSADDADEEVEEEDEEQDEEDANYIQENDDSFVDVHRPAFDYDDDSDEEDARHTQTGAFEDVALGKELLRPSLDAVDDEQPEEEGEEAPCVTVSIEDAAPPVVVAEAAHVQEQEPTARNSVPSRAGSTGERGSSLFSAPSGVYDPFLSVNDSFVGPPRLSTDSGDRSFLDDKPRPTYRRSNSFAEDLDASFRLDGYADSFSSAHNDSYAADHAPFASEAIDDGEIVNDEVISFNAGGSRQDESPEQEKAETVPAEPQPSNRNSIPFDVLNASSVRDSHDGDYDNSSFSSAINDSYVAAHAPNLATPTSAERIDDDSFRLQSASRSSSTSSAASSEVGIAGSKTNGDTMVRAVEGSVVKNPEAVLVKAPEAVAAKSSKAAEVPALKTPEPIAVKVREAAAVKDSEPVRAKIPEPIAVKAPEPAAVKASEPVTAKLPGPIGVKVPEPTAPKAPEPGALNNVEPATVKASEAESVGNLTAVAAEVPKPIAANEVAASDVPRDVEAKPHEDDEEAQIRSSRVPWYIPRDSGRPVDFRDSRHRFDEEEVPSHHVQPLSPMDQQDEGDEGAEAEGYSRENSLSNSISSSTSSLTRNDGNFFVGSDRGSDASSYSNSISDSFASMVIMGDTALDANSFVGQRPSNASIPQKSEGTQSDRLDRSYSSLIDKQNVGTSPAQSSTAQLNSVRPSSPGSILSVSSASTEDDLSFVSFNGGPLPPSSPAKPKSEAHSRSQASELSTSSSPVHAQSTTSVSARGSVSVSRKTGSFFDASFASSVDDSFSIPDLRERADTRSEEVEAGDVVQSALPTLLAPLKIALPVRPSATTSSSSSGLSSSFGSFSGSQNGSYAGSDIVRASSDKLDFTGVYRGSVNSLEGSRVGATPPTPTEPPAKKAPPQAKYEEKQPALASSEVLSLTAVRLARSVSDNAAQRESNRKVEEFFRRTHQYRASEIDDIDDDIRWTTRNRETRSRTTVIYCVDEGEEHHGLPNRIRSSTIATTKIIDLKALKGGPKVSQKPFTPQSEGYYIAEETPVGETRAGRLGSHNNTKNMVQDLGDELEEKGAVVVEDKRPASSSGSGGKNSSGYASTAASSNNSVVYASPFNYELSPKAPAPAKAGGFFAASASSAKRVGNRRTDNLSLTPSQPRISMDSSSFAPSPFTVAMLSKSPGMGAGFKFHQDNGYGLSPGSSVSIKDSLFRPTAISRPTFSEQVSSRVQQLSSSITSTLRRAGEALLGQSRIKQPAANGLTSPQSTCPAPPRLPRGFDERAYYTRFARRGGVEEAHDPPTKLSAPRSENQRKKQNSRSLRILASAVVGLVLGIILIHVSSLETVFQVDASEAHREQHFNGEMVVAIATQWMLIPGRLFLRVWNCVSMPLVFCHVANGVADIVMGEKESMVLGFRLIGIMLVISLIATLEGIGAMVITNRAGWFQASDSVKISAMTAAVGLERTIGSSVFADGAAGLLCSSNSEYLQMLDSSTFNCSNSSIPLPVYNGASGNATIQGSSPAIFALQDVNSIFTPTSMDASMVLNRYYPEGLNFTNAAGELLSTVVPNNGAALFAKSSFLGVVVFAAVVGLFCGKHALKRLIAFKHMMDSSTRSHNTRMAMAAEQNAQQPHYILGVLVELQLALEWILVRLEIYVAPLGVMSLVAGNLVLHFEEWGTMVSPMSQLIVGVLLLSLAHVLVVMPLFMKVCFKMNVFKLVFTPFLPSFLYVFCTGSLPLTAPITTRCFSNARVVTKSVGQIMASITSVLLRSGHALYFPLVLLWLMETNTLSANSSALDFSGSSYLYIAAVTLCSCFAALGSSSVVSSGITSHGNLAIMMALWRAIVSHSASGSAAATAIPMTFPLLVVCDVILSRVVNIVCVVDGAVATLLVADHADELVVDDVDAPSNSVISPVYL